MKALTLWLLLGILLGCQHSPPEVKCDRHLTPINPLAPLAPPPATPSSP